MTRCSGCSGSRRQHVDAARVGTGFRRFRGATDLRRSFDRPSAQVRAAPVDPLSGHVFVFQPPTQSGEVAGVGAGRVLAAVQAAGGRTFAVLDRDEINARELYRYWQDSRSYVSAAAD